MLVHFCSYVRDRRQYTEESRQRLRTCIWDAKALHARIVLLIARGLLPFAFLIVLLRVLRVHHWCQPQTTPGRLAGVSIVIRSMALHFLDTVRKVGYFPRVCRSPPSGHVTPCVLLDVPRNQSFVHILARCVYEI